MNQIIPSASPSHDTDFSGTEYVSTYEQGKYNIVQSIGAHIKSEMKVIINKLLLHKICPQV